ncbi:MAG: transporter [Verrucomicrobia bacterium]|nr:transporter [Verrucomicrobiota bacterium]
MLTLLAASSAAAHGESDAARNVEGIMDNSFLVEEAYNQEPGVVQHIFGAFYGVNKLRGPDDKSLNLAFIQEWPIFSQTHQFSYTVPYSFVRSDGQSSDGVGDVLLNYRYQAYFNKDSLTAFAPRVSLVLPTGDESKGFGDNSWGYQFNLPFSTTFGDKWFAHANAGLTFLPNAGGETSNDLLHYNLGASVIYAAKPDLHLMLEWIGNWNEGLNDLGGLRREHASIISPGVRKAFNYANHSQLVVGIAAPIGLTGPAPDFGVFLYVSFEHFFKKQK